MKQKAITGMIAAAVLVACGVGAGAANAVPAMASKTLAQSSKPATNPYFTQVRYYGHHFHHHGNNWGPWVAGGLLGLGIGAAISDGYGYDGGYYNGGYYDGYPASGGFERCEATFRSFNPATGLYMGYDGHLHRCPYI